MTLNSLELASKSCNLLSSSSITCKTWAGILSFFSSILSLNFAAKKKAANYTTIYAKLILFANQYTKTEANNSFLVLEFENGITRIILSPMVLFPQSKLDSKHNNILQVFTIKISTHKNSFKKCLWLVLQNRRKGKTTNNNFFHAKFYLKKNLQESAVLSSASSPSSWIKINFISVMWSQRLKLQIKLKSKSLF